MIEQLDLFAAPEQLKLFQRSGTERRRVLEARHGWPARNALANRQRSTWPRTFPTVSEPPPPAPRPARRLLVVAAVPTPWGEMTGTEKDAFCLKFAQAMNAQRAAFMDVLAGDSGT